MKDKLNEEFTKRLQLINNTINWTNFYHPSDVSSIIKFIVDSFYAGQEVHPDAIRNMLEDWHQDEDEVWEDHRSDFVLMYDAGMMCLNKAHNLPQ